MAVFDPELLNVLTSLADRIVAEGHLTPAERSEVLRIAQGMGCKDSAHAANVSSETIRARRKRIYRKLGADGASDVISRLLSSVLGLMAVPARAQPEQTQATAAST